MRRTEQRVIAWQLRQAPSLKTLLEFGHLAEDAELVLLDSLEVGEVIGSGWSSRSSGGNGSGSGSGRGGDGGVVVVNGLAGTDVKGGFVGGGGGTDALSVPRETSVFLQTHEAILTDGD